MWATLPRPLYSIAVLECSICFAASPDPSRCSGVYRLEPVRGDLENDHFRESLGHEGSTNKTEQLDQCCM